MPPEKVSLHQHGSGEFIHVLSGTLIVHIGDDQQTLGAATRSISIRGRTAIAATARTCMALVVTTA